MHVSSQQGGSLRGLTAYKTCDDMADGIEEEELRHNESLDNHDGGSSENEQEADEVKNTNGVQNPPRSTKARSPKASLGLLDLDRFGLGLQETEHDDEVEMLE